MLLEAMLDEKTALFIDCETAGGFAKDDTSNQFNPEHALDHVVRIGAALAGRLATATEALGDAHAALQMSFSVKVQGDGVVCAGRTPDDGQVKVTITRRG